MSDCLRHVSVPERSVGDMWVVARPRDGAPVVLPATAAVVWDQSVSWTAIEDIDRLLAARYPDVPSADRTVALHEILSQLEDEGLLDRR